ncbi:MAG: PQQ-dependent sugar dehydrogenase [Methylotenera sp.]|nr:PQQ-dependent sugar dehydrogenase [Methylotenera sp.]MDD4925827.1 PQQ-dependent sugar dehydrogenase [Methylotenera sp.]
MLDYLTQNIIKLLTLALLLVTPLAIASPDLTRIKLPAGFSIELFAGVATKNSAALRGVRFIAFDAKGNLYVSVAKANQVLMLPDANKDGIADDIITVAENLNAPQGLAFVGDDLLVANQNGVVKLKQINGKWSLPQPFITNLPAGGHTLKNIKLGADGFLYINVGSSCNVCLENDPLRATILRYSLDGKPAGALTTLGRHQQSAIWARGLRNSQGFAWHPITKQMFATNNGADNRSAIKNGAVNDELPPEHLNKIEAGKHYGWPHCWADPNNLNAQMEDPNFPAEPGFCNNTQAPALTFTSHTTPIGIVFLDKTNWPAQYKSDAIVAMHGSWNRKQAAGYQLVRVKFKQYQAHAVEDFATGWLLGNEAWGRPVDVAVGPDGALYVTDDKLDAIYRISYQGK